ncbi:unnamed protein product [Ostreobium quekettii]|uniref:SET domain-containing protein n=1 Tax=Ostreobium quekettii TaxID=121088 RepID=A0A8S1IRR9_9CHLO|nr:unnamed protein product [Ostreobium quekettii]|eukprot:evm.model.scf_35.16 EVM.evm.TU.scf_35.16   scf_35:134527-139496(+)
MRATAWDPLGRCGQGVQNQRHPQAVLPLTHWLLCPGWVGSLANGRVHKNWQPNAFNLSARPSRPARLPARACHGSSGYSETVTAEAQTSLQTFLAWAVANGVEGIGTEESNIGLYEAVGGERGVVCVKDVQCDEIVMRIPLSAGIIDYKEDEESNQLLYEGAPWSVRLACKLLRLKSNGGGSPWSPYISVLPRKVPSVLQRFEWEDIKEIEYGDLLRKLDYETWLVSYAWQRLDSAATGGASRDEFEWAMSIVHSRTFGMAAKEGGVGCHMLLPLADMLNHAGDRVPGLFRCPYERMDNVEWKFQPSQLHPSDWELVVSAIRNIDKGEEVLLSYGERSNDDFFLHYGFVPPHNPHDEVVLFGDLEEAVSWYFDNYLFQAGDDTSRQSLREAALAAGLAADTQQQQPLRLDGSADTEAGKIRVVAGSFVDGRLLEAFQVLGEGRGLGPVTAVQERCWDMLAEMASLEQDLSTLSQRESEHNFQYLAEFYTSAIGKYVEAGGTHPNLQKSRGQKPSESVEGKPESTAAKPLTPASQAAITFRAYKKIILWDVILGLARL